jgi:DNA repair exonuclease SbcCD nuclease subunit
MITKPKIAIFSDLHLGKHNNSRDWHRVAIDWCDWFITELRQRKIKDVIFCGDWHDNRSEISVHTLDVSGMLIDKFQEFNLHMVIGNHDIPYKHGTEVNSVSIYSNRPNIRIYTQPYYVTAFDRVLCFTPWGSDITMLQKCDVLFGHLEIQTFKMGPVRVCDKGWTASDLLKKCGLTFSGHFHIRDEKKYKEGSIIYTGNPFQMDFGDRSDTKGFYVLDLDTLTYEFINNTVSPEHYVIKLSHLNKDGLDKFKTKIIGNCIKLDVDIEYDIKELFILFDKIAAYKPFSFTPDYTYIAPEVEFVSGDDSICNGIDIKHTIIEYVEAVEIYGREKCVDYLTNLYEKCK